MHYTDCIVPAVIVVWAAFEYHRREQEFKEKMAYFARGLPPPQPAPFHPSWRLWTTGLTALSLFAFVAGMVFLGITTLPRYRTSFFLIALPFAFLLPVLLLILRRDYRIARRVSDRKGDS
ncbi:MAG: hypothetical protein FJ215_08885 [Ignavibacteria bacterium]|nr:hypothetical protein [Ignavibacteria bacterium]